MARRKVEKEFVVDLDVELHGVKVIVSASDENHARAKAEALDYSNYDDSGASINNLSVRGVEENI